MYLGGLRKSTVFPDSASQAGLGLCPVPPGSQAPQRALTPVSLGQQSWAQRGCGFSGRCHSGNSWAQLCPEDAAPASPGTQGQTPFPAQALRQEARPGQGTACPRLTKQSLPAPGPAVGRPSLSSPDPEECVRFFPGCLPCGVTSAGRAMGWCPRVSENKSEGGLLASGRLHPRSRQPTQEPPRGPVALGEPGPNLLQAGRCGLRPRLVQTVALLTLAR